VLVGVPAVGGDVDAAGEGDAVVDDHDLLVVRAADRVVLVDGEHQPVGSPPVEQHDRRQAARQGDQHADVPVQDADLQLRVAPDGGLEHPAQPVGAGGAVPAGIELDARVEVPADEQHPAARAQHRLLQRREVVGGVHEDGEPVGPLDPPARLPRDQQVLGGDRPGTPVGHPVSRCGARRS
jgi:hypothetical protein